MVAGEKEKSADDYSAFEPPRKVCCVKQGDAPDRSKTKSTAEDRRKLESVNEGKPQTTVSTSTQRQECCGQAGSTEVQTEEPDS